MRPNVSELLCVYCGKPIPMEERIRALSDRDGGEVKGFIHEGCYQLLAMKEKRVTHTVITAITPEELHLRTGHIRDVTEAFRARGYTVESAWIKTPIDKKNMIMRVSYTTLGKYSEEIKADNLEYQD